MLLSVRPPSIPLRFKLNKCVLLQPSYAVTLVGALTTPNMYCYCLNVEHVHFEVPKRYHLIGIIKFESSEVGGNVFVLKIGDV